MNRQANEQRLETGRTEERELRRRVEMPVETGSAMADVAMRARSAASAAVVNRTHRIIRERARVIQDRKSRIRSLLMPLAVCSGLLLVICASIWTVLDEYELAPTGIPDASQQMLVLLMWVLPLTAVLIALVWTRGTGSRAESGSAR